MFTVGTLQILISNDMPVLKIHKYSATFSMMTDDLGFWQHCIPDDSHVSCTRMFVARIKPLGDTEVAHCHVICAYVCRKALADWAQAAVLETGHHAITSLDWALGRSGPQLL